MDSRWDASEDHLGVEKSCYGIFRARTKREIREGSQWFDGASVGQQREKGYKGQVVCKQAAGQQLIWPCLSLPSTVCPASTLSTASNPF